MPMTLEQFRQEVAKLPVEKQATVIRNLFDMIYSGYDDKIFRVMATAIKQAKEVKTEGHENFQIEEKELEKLSHIQDHNRLIQTNRKK